MLRSLDSLDQFCDDRTIERSQGIDFPLEVPDLVDLIELLLLVDLDGDFLSIPLIEAHPDENVRAFPELTENLKVLISYSLINQDKK